ncbi:hypothetical protein GCM10010520_53800 [Rhizobium viscosum]|uniref:Uncharacterized protein n=1 Tax=Rhizobium viscosum TaxID=1673 RepID=A0ABR9J0B3_RHIVS|nr:hypothetical protein [Rhizobium viscosum]MBE1508821.1 hypothetical protein [Rhizobium viscosum]
MTTMSLTENDEPGDRGILSALRQIKAFAKESDSDCSCTLIIGELLAHLVPRQRAAVVQELFMSALRQRTKVGTLLELLRELDQFGPASEIGEVDEAALIFDDVAKQARMGSQLLRAFAANRRDILDAQRTFVANPAGERLS